MMSGRSKRCSLVVFCGIALICLCVVMYVLGSTMTLWTMQFAFDQTDNPVLEAFALPTMPADIIPAMPVTSSGDRPAGAKGEVNEHSLLRPPNQTA